jgi:tRNA(adenine34) deaminase
MLGSGEYQRVVDGSAVSTSNAALLKRAFLMASPARQSIMEIALEEARLAGQRGEVPVGAVITGPNGQLLARAGNRSREQHDPTAHAEMLVIRETCQKLGSERLIDCDLHVTLEPCPMCAAAISFARIRRLYFGASDMKSGGVDHGPRVFSHATCHHAPEVYGGIGESEAQALLRAFFAERRGA